LHPVRQLRHGLPARRIRAKVSTARSCLAPLDLQIRQAEWRAWTTALQLQVSPEDCTGAPLRRSLPAKSKTDPAHKALNMQPQQPLRFPERDNWDFFQSLPTSGATSFHEPGQGLQLLEPLLILRRLLRLRETPYIKLLTRSSATAHDRQRHRLLLHLRRQRPLRRIARTKTPRSSLVQLLFEDNAEFGLGMRLAATSRRHTRRLVQTPSS